MKIANKNFIFTKITTRRCILLKRMLSILFGILVIFACAAPASAVFDSGEITDNLKSHAYYMQSLDEETVLFKKNENEKLPMAGFVKIVATVTAIEKWADLDEKIKVTNKNLSLVKYDYSVRTAGYKEGEKISKRELINCLVVYSANDAASIIAYEVSGSLEAFTAEMNAVLQRIGCESTVVKNSSSRPILLWSRFSASSTIFKYSSSSSCVWKAVPFTRVSILLFLSFFQ